MITPPRSTPPGPQLPRRRPFRLLAAPAFAVLLAACGGTASVDSAAADGASDVAEGVSSDASAEEAAAANLPNLATGETVFDVEVLSVADGSVSSLRDTVTGDRPVLVWFWAPH